jgi:hypothetical protein
VTDRSLALEGHETNSCLERGWQLFEERSGEVEHLEGDVWLVPSSNLITGSYLVNVAPKARCECKDFEFRPGAPCKHITAAREAHAKSRVCSCCRRRVLGRFLLEVTEEDGLLSWFVGDELCSDCIREGYWV